MLPTGTPYIIQVHSFHVLAHSFALFCIRKKINSLCFQAIPNSLAKTPGGGGSESSFLRRLDVGTFRCSFCIPNGVTGRSPIRPIAAKRLWCHNPQRYEISSRSGETTPLLPVSKNSERTSGTPSTFPIEDPDSVGVASRSSYDRTCKKAWVHRSNAKGVLTLDRSRVARVSIREGW